MKVILEVQLICMIFKFIGEPVVSLILWIDVLAQFLYTFFKFLLGIVLAAVFIWNSVLHFKSGLSTTNSHTFKDAIHVWLWWGTRRGNPILEFLTGLTFVVKCQHQIILRRKFEFLLRVSLLLLLMKARYRYLRFNMLIINQCPIRLILSWLMISH
jgi:hypothetical protein